MGFDGGLKTISKALLSGGVLGVATASAGLIFPEIAHAELERSAYREVTPKEFEQRFWALQD